VLSTQVSTAGLRLLAFALWPLSPSASSSPSSSSSSSSPPPFLSPCPRFASLTCSCCRLGPPGPRSLTPRLVALQERRPRSRLKKRSCSRSRPRPCYLPARSFFPQRRPSRLLFTQDGRARRFVHVVVARLVGAECAAGVLSLPAAPPIGLTAVSAQKRMLGEAGRASGGGRDVGPRGRIPHQGERHQPRRKWRRPCPAAPPRGPRGKTKRPVGRGATRGAAPCSAERAASSGTRPPSSYPW
jgi:hypothetical protein